MLIDHVAADYILRFFLGLNGVTEVRAMAGVTSGNLHEAALIVRLELVNSAQAEVERTHVVLPS